MDTQGIVSQIVAAVAPLVVGLLAAILAFALKRLNDWIRLRVRNETLEAALLQVSEAVATTVNDIEKEVRIYMTDGKLSKVEQQELKALAKRRIFEQVPAALGTVAQAGFKNIEEFVAGKIEQYVGLIKSRES